MSCSRISDEIKRERRNRFGRFKIKFYLISLYDAQTETKKKTHLRTLTNQNKIS